jgi:hypothetical protein
MIMIMITIMIRFTMLVEKVYAGDPDHIFSVYFYCAMFDDYVKICRAAPLIYVHNILQK